MIRPATIDDAQDIANLWNVYVRNSTATFNPTPYTASDIVDMIRESAQHGWGFFIAHQDNLLGFAKYKQFRGGAGYIHSMEHGIYLDDRARGQGTGTALMHALEHHARAHNVHSLTGVVTSKNIPSIKFHEKLGFQNIGEMREIGYKFDKWHDAIFLYKLLK